jgi:hypothetical protein
MAKRKKSAPKAKTAAPWKRAAPKGSAHHHLTPAKKAAAKKRARRAGRPYPNLVDNMAAASTGARKRKAKS